MSNQQANITEVVTGEARLSYVHLSQPRARTGKDPQYSVTVLIPKIDAATKQRLDAAIAAAIQQGVAGKWNGVRPPMVPIPIHDGDGVRPSDGMPFGAECKGHWVFTATDTRRPEIVDANLNPIINPVELYSGMYGRVSVRFYPYFSEGKKGIGCGLGPVQKLRDGEPLAGSATTAAAAFGGAGLGLQPLPYGAPVAQPQQQVYQAPVQQQYAAPVQQQPVYQAPAAPQYVQQPAASVAAPVIDPITGQPVQPPVMGLG